MKELKKLLSKIIKEALVKLLAGGIITLLTMLKDRL